MNAPFSVRWTKDTGRFLLLAGLLYPCLLYTSTDLRQLSLFPAEEEIQETGRSGTERPVSLSPDEIDDILHSAVDRCV